MSEDLILQALEASKANFEKINQFFDEFKHMQKDISSLQAQLALMTQPISSEVDDKEGLVGDLGDHSQDVEKEKVEIFYEASDADQLEESGTTIRHLEGRNKPTASFSPLIQAHKYHKLVVPPLPAEGGPAIEIWLRDALTSLAEAVPQLSEVQLINVVSSNLPEKIHAIVRGCRIENTEHFVEHVTAIFSNSELGTESAKRKFYGYSAAGKELLEVIADLTSLSHNLNLKEHERKKALNTMFIECIPLYNHRITLKSILRDREDMDLLDLSKIIHTNVNMKIEIEKSFKRQMAEPVIKTKHVQQIQGTTCSSGSQGGLKQGKEKNKQIKQKPRGSTRCARCGYPWHVTDECPLYSKTSTVPCSDCKSLIKYSHFHEPEECIVRPKVSQTQKN